MTGMGRSIVGERSEDLGNNQQLAVPAVEQREMSQFMAEHGPELIGRQSIDNGTDQDDVGLARKKGNLRVQAASGLGLVESDRHFESQNAQHFFGRLIELWI